MELTIGERLAIVKILNANGNKLNFSGMRLMWKIADKVELTEEERKTAGYTEMNGKIFFKDISATAIIDFKSDEKELLISLLKKHDAESNFDLSDGKAMVTMSEKFGIKEEEKEKK